MDDRNGGTGVVDEDVGDEELMRRLAAGRPEALQPLHARYAPIVFGIAVRPLGRAAAEEVVQEVFLAVWRKAASFDPARGSLRGWLLRIARNHVLNEIRSRSRRPHTEGSADSDDLAVDPAPGPSEALWQSHRRVVLLEAIEALPARQAQALRLAYFEELTHEQVASLLRLPLGTAKSRIQAGLRSLRTRLAGVVAIGLTLAALGAFALDRAALRRQERALRLLTASDIVPLRLAPAPGVAPETHGSYRGRRGEDIAVMTFTAFPPAPRGFSYRAWSGRSGRWIPLGKVRPDASGRDLLIIEGPSVTEPPGALRVTLEPSGASGGPTGPTIVAWPPIPEPPPETLPR